MLQTHLPASSSCSAPAFIARLNQQRGCSLGKQYQLPCQPSPCHTLVWASLAHAVLGLHCSTFSQPRTLARSLTSTVAGTQVILGLGLGRTATTDAAVTCPVGFPAGARGVPSCCVCNLGPAVLLPVVLVALGVVARRVLGFMELVWTPQPASCDSQVYLPNAHSTLHDARQTQMATHHQQLWLRATSCCS